jgi:hypothetical protein
VVVFNTTPSPAENNYLPLPGVSINEVLTHTDPPLEDAIELFNSSSQTSGIGGYYLSDSKRNLKKYRVADGATVPAGGFRVFYETQFNSGAPGSFALNSSRGGTVYLSATDAGGNLTGYRSLFPFGPQINGTSFGRVGSSVGEDFPPLIGRSFGVDNPANVLDFRNGSGSNNPPPKIGPIVINEIMYHPVDGAANLELAEQEFVELHNLGGVAASLFDATNPGNTWRLTGGVTFGFPTGISIPARGYFLVVRFDPVGNPGAAAAFRLKYGLPVSVPLYGPFAGRLGNDGDVVVLEMPDKPQGPGPDQGYVPYVLVDKVSYTDAYPWPAEADGTGVSLQRRRTYAFGNDPINWKAGPQSAGRANVAGSTFTDTDHDGIPDDWEDTHSMDRNSAADALTDRDGDGHSNYEEYLDGTDLASAASGLSAPAIINQPVDVNSTGGMNALLSVSANSTAPLQYQWRKNGFPIDEATNTSLSFTPLTVFDSGNYSVVVWNGAGFVVSRIARVTVAIALRITLQPSTLIVNPGSNVTFMVAATGTGLLRYQWQKDGQDIPGATLPTLVINNAQLANEAEYVALVSDDLSTVPTQGARLVVKVAPTIVSQPKGSTNLVGSSVTFTVGASGSIPMGFRWHRGSTVLTNVPSLLKTNTFTINNLTLADSGVYRVVVTNAGNTSGVVSVPTSLLVVEPPAITTQPQSQIVELGSNATFSVSATGTGPLVYQWYFAGALIPNATNSSYTLLSAQVANQGEYRVVVSNVGASVSSSGAVLTVASALRLSDPEILANGHVRMRLSGAPNRNYFIESSSNLTSWFTLDSIFYTNGLMPYVDTTSPGVTNRFYRARE